MNAGMKISNLPNTFGMSEQEKMNLLKKYQATAGDIMDRTAQYVSTPNNPSAYISNTPKPYSGVAQGFDQNVSGTKVVDGLTVNNGIANLPTNRNYYAPVSATPSIAPQQIATPVNPVRPQVSPIDPMQVKFQPGWNDPKPVTTVPAQSVVDPLFKNVNHAVAQGYQSTLADAITGKIYDPTAAGAREAMARSEANSRAGTAAQVASAGFSGTGIGKQAGSATEDQMLKQRFDTNIGIEQARNASRIAALPEAVNYAKSSTEAMDATKQAAGKDFAAYVTNDPNITVDSIDSDPALKTSVQKLWESLGQIGPYDRNWAAQKIQAVKDTENTYVMADKAIDYAVTQGTVKLETAKVIKSLFKNEAVLAAYDIDANGNAVINPERMEKATGVPAGTLTEPTTTEATPFNVSEKTYDPVTASLEQNWSKDADKILTDNPTGEVAKAIAAARAKSLIEGKKPWSDAHIVPGDLVYNSLVATMPEKYIGRNNAGNNWREVPGVNEIVKIPDGKGGFMLAKRVGDPYGNKTKVLEFVSLDGNTKRIAKFNVGGSENYTSWTDGPAGTSFGSIIGNKKVTM